MSKVRIILKFFVFVLVGMRLFLDILLPVVWPLNQFADGLMWGDNNPSTLTFGKEY